MSNDESRIIVDKLLYFDLIIINLQSNLIQKMKFIVPGVNVKHLGKAIHCLAKIGDEVYLDSESDALILRTVNISRY